MAYEDDGYGELIWVDDGTDAEYDYSTGYSNYDSGDMFGGSQYWVDEITNTALPGQEGYGWRYFADGTVMDPSGKYYMNNPDTGKTELVYDPSSAAGGFMTKLFNSAKNAFTKPDGSINWAALATAGTALYNQFGDDKTGGYNKPVPKMEAVRQQVQYDDTNRRPGEGGRQYFTDTQFVAKGDAAAKDAALQAAATQAAGLRAAAPQSTAPAANPWAGKMNLDFLKPTEKSVPVATTQSAAVEPLKIQAVQGFDALPTANQTQGLAMGGIANLAKGGRYLSGKTDGMADKIPTKIDGKDPAALSHGEFVIPADVVSHLGNGNSDAGAKKLYDMMARIRKARTGNEKQGKRINPDKFMPGGLAAAYAAGGTVKGFAGETGSAVVGSGGAGGIEPDVSKTSTLSPWVGDYVTDALGQGAALAAQPYQAYQGPLTAGASDLQNQAFAGASELAQTGYTPGTFTAGTFDTAAANQYMNPYLSAALQPSLDEARRQAQISRLSDASRLTKAGAFGGGRQAIMESELNRNLMDKQNQLLTQGYATAYDKAMAQYNADQARSMEAQKADEAARQFGANYAQTSLKDLASLGATQRDIEQQGIAADKAQFEESRDWAYKMPEYQLKLLSGLPIGAQTSTSDPGTLARMQGDIAGLASLYQTLSNLGQKSS